MTGPTSRLFGLYSSFSRYSRFAPRGCFCSPSSIAGLGHRRVRYSVIERVPLHQGQIIRTYLAGWGVLLWYVSLWWLFAPIERIVGQGHEPWIAIGWMLLPFAVLFGWQRLYMPRPKLKPVELSPGSEHSIYQQADGTSAKPAAQRTAAPRPPLT